MTRLLKGKNLAGLIDQRCSGSVVKWNETDVWIRPESLVPVCKFLKDSPELDFSFLTSISAVDYIEYFELVYHLLSLRKNQRTIIKTSCMTRDGPQIASLLPLWRGAELQEREIWDLMGIHFDGHPNMKRIMLWEGFDGHPLRKDFLR